MQINHQRDSSVELAERADFAMGDIQVSPTSLSIVQGKSRHILQPKVMQVLIALAEASPAVISREKLIARCWNGRVVGDDALNRCIVVLRRLSRKLDNGFLIENVARVGYKLVVHNEAGLITSVAHTWQKLATAVLVIGVTVAGLVAGQHAIVKEPNFSANTAQNTIAKVRLLDDAGRAMLRTENPQLAGEARVSFQQALALDADNALAWIGLAEAKRSEASLQGQEAVIAVLPEVRSEIRRALAINPRLASAHTLLGEVLGTTNLGAENHLLLAAQLNPNLPESQLGLAAVRRANGDFKGEIAAYWRAHVADLTWYRPLRDLSIATAEMGARAKAMKYAGLITRAWSGCSGPAARIAWIYGDITESASCQAGATKTDTVWRRPALLAIATARLTLGLSDDGSSAAPIHILDVRPPQGRILMASAPDSAIWRFHNRNADAALVYRLDNLVAAKLMLKEGRQLELAATYAGPSGLLGIRRGIPIQAADLPAVPIVALALRRTGSLKEAKALLLEATRVMDAANRLGPVPFTFEAESAAVEAAIGDKDRAISDLQRARSRGWVNLGWGDLLDIREEPAYAELKSDPRFRVIASGLDKLYALERRKFIDAKL